MYIDIYATGTNTRATVSKNKLFKVKATYRSYGYSTEYTIEYQPKVSVAAGESRTSYSFSSSDLPMGAYELATVKIALDGTSNYGGIIKFGERLTSMGNS